MERPKIEDYEDKYSDPVEGLSRYSEDLQSYIDHLETEREEREEEIKAYKIAIKGLQAVHEITKPHQP